MTIDDDPSKPEFASWESYRLFEQRVRRDRRYVWQPNVQAFLDTVLATVNSRAKKIHEGKLFYSAQRDVRSEPIRDKRGNEIGGEEIVGVAADRLKPLPNRARQGRANPSGIPALYLASAEVTAVSEVRPWVGSMVSVAQFRVQRALRVVDLSAGHGQSAIGTLTIAQILGEEEVDAGTKEQAVWVDIDSAFSRPVTLADEATDYVPTQILAELFQNAGFDGLVYRSQFGEKGFNIALFSLDDAEPLNCAPFEVKSVEVTYKECGSRWFTGGRKKRGSKRNS